MSPGITKRIVVITGASRGLGRELALCFGARGDRVVVNYLSREREADAVASEIIQRGGEAVAARADVRNSTAVDAMIEDTLLRWGKVDILVNNAGITGDGLLLRMPEKDWDTVVGTDLTGVYYCIRSAARYMTMQQSGHIISISSIVGVQGRAGQANYSAAKAGLIGLTKACAKELGEDNVCVNAVLPGYLGTEMGKTVSNAVLDKILHDNVLHRGNEPAEVADFIYNLSMMKNVSGQIFNLDSRIV